MIKQTTDSRRKIVFKNLETGKTKTQQKSFINSTDANEWVEQFNKTEHLEVISVKVEDHLSIKEKLRIARETAITEML